MCTYSPTTYHPFYILNQKMLPLKHFMFGWRQRKKFYSFLRVWCLVCLCETGGQLLLQEWNNLNVNASRLARCKIITVLCVLAIRCRSLYTVRLFVIILAVCQFGFLTAAVVFKENWGVSFWIFLVKYLINLKPPLRTHKHIIWLQP